MLLMIDNYDSFTYNLVQYFGELGETVHVARNDEITLEEIARLAPQRICLSPGPCSPTEAGVTLAVLDAADQRFARCDGHWVVSPVRRGAKARCAPARRAEAGGSRSGTA